ncbi:MAG: hypothetical protein RIQ93_601 [Verrucomicrobiota bacterium]|jgi:paraquat-inducible protein B
MNIPPAPKVSRARAFSLVWVVPVIALAVGGWMIFRELRQRGPEITIEFADGSGIEANKTILEHKGVAIGSVRSVKLMPDHLGVEVQLRLDRDAAGVATRDATFWVVRPEIGLSGVRGLDMLLTGARLAVRPGVEPPATRFKGLDRTPPPDNSTDGRAFVLEADQLGSLNPGAPVFFREFKVGSVETSWLADSATAVLIRIRVFAPYVNLVRTNSRFWNAGGVSLKLNLLGAQVKSTSLESLFAGGIAFATPDGKTLAPPAEEGARFKLNAEADKDWLKWRPSIPVQSEEASPKPETNSAIAEALKK